MSRNKYIPAPGSSYSNDYLMKRNAAPQVSALMVKGVSEVRKGMLQDEVLEGKFRDGTGPNFNENGLTANATVMGGGIKKTAQMTNGGSWGGGGNSVQQMPEVYSPLWLTSNLNLPRDRATINAWCRSFFALNPFVHNAINLHSTYPISKLSIKCHNPEVARFFNDMIEEIDLMNICVQIAQEFWLLGEAFVYAEYDENKGKWSRLMLQNPDYMDVKRSVVANEPVIMLKPDQNLQQIVRSNKPADIEQRKQLDPHIIDSVKRGNNILLNNFNVSHLARKISPYENRGTGLPVCIFRQLMLMDKLRECYSEDTEVLTNQGFKKIKELVHVSNEINPNPNYVNGIELDENGQIAGVLTMKEDFTVACFNQETDEIEYHKPIELHMSAYKGKMIHFSGQKVDVLVSPNHKMLAKENINSKWGEYKKITASQMLEKKKYWRFKSRAKYTSNNVRDYVLIGDKKIPTKLYLKVLGYVVSEGCVYENYENGRYDAKVIVSQLTSSDCYDDMRSSFALFAEKLGKNVCNKIINTGAGYSENSVKDLWEGSISGKELTSFLKSEIGVNNSTLSADKHLPRWVLDLKPELLEIVLKSMVSGDGSEIPSKYNDTTIGYKYYTISKQLADDVYELSYKLGFVPTLASRVCREPDDKNPNFTIEYIVSWSNTNYGNAPIVNTFSEDGRGGGASTKEVDYNGTVWCFEVPTGLFITRRNGKITIQGNSKFVQSDSMINPLTLVKVGGEGPDALHPTHADLESWRQVFEEGAANKDFKIFTHAGVSVEKIGSGAGIYDTSADISQLVKEIYVGLQVPPVLMDGGADTSYANGGVALDVLRQRYMQFRNMLSSWLRRKIFAPISKIQGFYEYKPGTNNTEKHLIVPEIDWNHMSLFDAGDYINTLVGLTTPGPDGDARASLSTLYRSLGLELEDEQRKMRKEAIYAAISKKEKAALESMELNELRSLDDEDEIPEPTPAPGQNAQGDAAVPGEMGSNEGVPGAGLLPPPPPK